MRIEYIGKAENTSSLGVLKKITNTVNAFKESGYDAKQNIIKTPGLRGHLALPIAILKSNASLIIVRSTSFSFILCAIPILYKRALGSYVVVDVPTPLSVVTNEISIKNSFLKRTALKLILNLNHPISLLSANKIVHYSKEEKKFLVGIKSKSIITGNGFDVSSVGLAKENKNLSAYHLSLIGVATLEPWHGFDRLIKGIADYNSAQNKKYKIKFTIVGNGSERSNLETLSKSLKTDDSIQFSGSLNGVELDAIFERSDLAVGSLGLHRIGLTSASTLKTREYLARGLPTIISTSDIDLPDNLDFIYKATEDDTSLDLNSIIAWYENYVRIGSPPKEIRRFAFNFLDYSKKINVYIK